jgi:hypothetical protein
LFFTATASGVTAGAAAPMKTVTLFPVLLPTQTLPEPSMAIPEAVPVVPPYPLLPEITPPPFANSVTVLPDWFATQMLSTPSTATPTGELSVALVHAASRPDEKICVRVKGEEELGGARFAIHALPFLSIAIPSGSWSPLPVYPLDPESTRPALENLVTLPPA